MLFGRKARSIQERLRNAGWRIEVIPWWEQDKPQIIYPKNPLPLIGLILFISTIFGLPWSYFDITLGPYQMIALLVTGLVIVMLGILLSAFQTQINWLQIDARCIDREIAQYLKEPGDISTLWDYRIVCTFTLEGKEYKVTPNPSHLVAFNSKRKVEKYLEQRIDDKANCTLWVNPDNPLQTVFHKRVWWIQ